MNRDDDDLLEWLFPGIGLFASRFDRALRPWRYPDRPDWPAFVPFPTLARAGVSARRLQARIGRTVDTLRYGTDEENDW